MSTTTTRPSVPDAGLAGAPGSGAPGSGALGAAADLAEESARLAALGRRARAVREQLVAMAAAPTGAHLGGGLSAADILVALYFEVLRVRPEQPRWIDRDHFVLSKGHAGCALYATLAERGFFDPAELADYGREGTRFPTHPTTLVPGVEFATGSLGHGLSLGVGLAVAARRAGRDNRVFVLLGDGELQEGSVWEAAMCAAHLGLDNLTAVVDRNRLQINGGTEDRMALEPLPDKWRAFGWAVSEVDGHDLAALVPALRATAPGGPRVVLADTVKGRGVRFLEGRKQSHFVQLTAQQRARALASLAVRP